MTSHQTSNATIYRSGAFHADVWRPWHGDTSSDIDDTRGVIAPFHVWRNLRQKDGFQARLTGVEVSPEALEEADVHLLAQAGLIVVKIPKFTDGRAYSLARRLRDTHGYKGELRATGDVLLDQIALLERCGFDSFEITHAPTIRFLTVAGSTLPSLATAYQVAGDVPGLALERMPRMRPSLVQRSGTSSI